MLLGQTTAPFNLVTNLASWVILLFIAALAAILIWKMADGTIDLAKVISEPTGDASMSRLQLLVFTFVIATSLFLIIVHQLSFPSVIPQGVLVLLGISSSSYLVSKGIQFSSADGIVASDPSITIAPQRYATKAGGPAAKFTADLIKVDAIAWSVYPMAGMGSIDQSGTYTPPQPPFAGDPPTGCVEIVATSTSDASVTDLAVVHLG